MNLTIHSLHKTKDSKKLKVAAYARISYDKKELESSLENQIRHYTSLINSNPDWEFAGIYADDGISGSTVKKRNQFQLMLTKAFAGEIDIILVKSISRFARNLLDMLKVVQELRDSGVEVYFEKEGISSLDTKCDNYLTLYSKFAEEELISMSKNVSWSYQKRIRDGKFFINANQLFGYKFDKDRNIVIEECEAKYVKDIFMMYLAGKNTGEISDYLEEHHVLTQTGLSRWSGQSIRQILKNEKYCGMVILQKTYTQNVLTQKRHNNDGKLDKVIIENALPPIVSKEVYLEAQERMESLAEKYNLSGGRNAYDHTNSYTAFGYCPYCRSPYFRKWNHGNETLYCSSNKERARCKGSESVFVKHLDEIIPLMVKKLLANENEFKKELLDAFSDKVLLEKKERIDALTKEIDDQRDKLLQYDGLSGDAFDAIKEYLRKNINELSDEKAVLENEWLIEANPETRVNEIIKELHRFPTDDKVGDYDFRKLFKRMIVINRDRLIFVVGSDNLENLPYNPQSINMKFIETYRYKIRCTWFTCNFGIYINK